MHRSRLVVLPAAMLAVAMFGPALLAQADVGLPNPPPFPDENFLLPNQDILGKFLFWEEQMGGDNTMSCGTCHIHETGGSDPRSFKGVHPGPDGIFGNDDDVAGSPGVVLFDRVGKQFVHEGTFFPNPQVTGRKSPSAINAAHFTNVGMFWDGRAVEEFVDPMTGEVSIMFGGALESQAAGPPVNSVEMGGMNQTWEQICEKLSSVRPMALATNLPSEMQDYLDLHPTYGHMFADVYGDNEITSERVIFAIANYERTLIADQTPVDDQLNGVAPLTPELQAGLDLFLGAANCSACHTLPTASDLNFHNIGTRPDAEDIGLEAVTGSFFDRAKFKTPNIRNAKLRTPLFHAGTAATVRDVIEFYNRGGDFDDNGLKDSDIFELNLTEQEIQSLVDLVEIGFTDPRVEQGLFPFTRPTLRSEMPQLNTLYGVESLNGMGVPPLVLAHHTASLGNSEFLIGVDEATPSQMAVAAFAFNDDPRGTLFPDPRFPVPVNLDLDTLFLILETTTDAFGVASVNLPIPNNQAVVGLTVYAQWFIVDPLAVATGRVYGSKGIEIPLL